MSRLPPQLCTLSHTPVCHGFTGWISFSGSLFFSFPQRDSKVQPSVEVSPNSCLDSEKSRPVPVRLRQRSSARCESTRTPFYCGSPDALCWLTSLVSGHVAGQPRPVSMPVVSSSGRSDPSLAAPAGRQGESPAHPAAVDPSRWSSVLFWVCPGVLSSGHELLHRCLSNEGIGAITEEEPCFPLPYRGHPSLRGVDHIRGSRCFINADLHNSATMPYQEAPSKKTASAGSSDAPPAPPPSNKQPTSLLGGWLARLRLLSH